MIAGARYGVESLTASCYLHPMSEVTPFTEILAGLRQIATNIDQLGAGQARIDERLGAIESRLEVFDSRLDAVGTRLDGFGTRLDDFGTQLDDFGSRLDGFGARLDAFESRLVTIESLLVGLDARVGILETRIGLLETGLDQTKLEVLKLRVDMMERLDRFQVTLDNVRESTAVTLMMDQRVAKKLKETDKDRDDLFEQMMAIERQLMTLSLRIEAIEDQRH